MLRAWDLPTPEVLVTSVGTEIYWRGPSGHLRSDEGFARHISKGWDAEAVTRALDRIAGLKPQDPVEQRAFKRSYLTSDAATVDRVRAALRAAGIEARVVHSHDTLLDVLPKRAGKGAALRRCAEALALPLSACVAAGDSGNDIDMLETAGPGDRGRQRCRGAARIPEARASPRPALARALCGRRARRPRAACPRPLAPGAGPERGNERCEGERAQGRYGREHTRSGPAPDRPLRPPPGAWPRRARRGDRPRASAGAARHDLLRAGRHLPAPPRPRRAAPHPRPSSRRPRRRRRSSTPPARRRTLHCAPLGWATIRQAMAEITGWFHAADPALFVSDVSAEIAQLARIASVPCVKVLQHGERSDPGHMAAYEACVGLLAPYDARLEQPDRPDWMRARTFHAGGIGTPHPAHDRRCGARHARARSGARDDPRRLGRRRVRRAARTADHGRAGAARCALDDDRPGRARMARDRHRQPRPPGLGRRPRDLDRRPPTS